MMVSLVYYVLKHFRSVAVSIQIIASVFCTRTIWVDYYDACFAYIRPMILVKLHDDMYNSTLH